MSDPFKGNTPDHEDNVAKKLDESKAKDPDGLSLGNISGSKKGETEKRESTDPTIERTLGKLDIDVSRRSSASYTFPIGQRSQFQLKKSEFTKTDPETSLGMKPALNDFLQKTQLPEGLSIPASDLQEINQNREALSNATNTKDVVSNALRLARTYQRLRYIEEAKKAIDLSLGIDPDNYYGRQLFKELERMHPADIGIASKAISSQPLTKSNLRKRIHSLTGGKVIVVGDLLIDELLEGKPERISREAPVLILEHVDTELIPGGAANTANNIAALGGKCHAIGVCGEDQYALKMAELFDNADISHDLVTDPSRPTTVKTRILSKSHSFKQQLLRLDRISHQKVAPHIEQALLKRIKNAAGDYAAIVLSDYRGGVMTDEVIRGCRAIAKEKNVMLIVDAQNDFARFQDVTLLTPNQPDTEQAVGFQIKSKESLAKAGEELLMITGAKAVLITRGGEGMVLFQQNEEMIELPAFNRIEVFDVTGAGDTVVATMSLALVTGSSFLEAMALGNLAGAIVVKIPGTAVTNQKEMLETLEMLKLEES